MKPTEWGYGVQTSHLFPLVKHLGILHFSPSFSTLKIGINTKSICVNPWGHLDLLQYQRSNSKRRNLWRWCFNI